MASRKKIKKQQKKKRFLFRLLFLLSFFLFLGALLYFVFFFGYFQIKKVNFSGHSEVALETLQNFFEKFEHKKTGFLKLNENIIFFNSKSFKNDLQSQFLQIKEVKINRIWPNELKITIEERQPTAVFCPLFFKRENTENINEEKIASQTEEFKELSQKVFWSEITSENCFYIDLGGFAFAEASFILGGRLANIFENKQQASILGKNVISKEMVTFLNDVQRGLLSMDIETYKFFVNKKDKEVDILTKDGWTLYVSTDQEVANQLLVLKRSLEEKIKEDISLLQYIDLRVPGRIYYKLQTD